MTTLFVHLTVCLSEHSGQVLAVQRCHHVFGITPFTDLQRASKEGMSQPR